MPGTTVFLVGTSGAGKSTLGNYLLYEVPCHDEGFLTGAGQEGVTTSCESRQEESQRFSPFKVVDTPGIPDSNGNNKTFFDCIVQATRDAGSLNAIIFVVDVPVNRKDVEKSTKNASVLLEQFNKTGCTLIMACRVSPHLSGLSVEMERQTERYWNKYATDISTAAGLRVSSVFFLAMDVVSQARAIRALVTSYPAVEITSDSGMQTFDELKRGVENRRNAHTRRTQLEEDVERLTRETAALQRTIILLEEKDRLYTRLSTGVQKAGAAIQCLDTLTAGMYVVEGVALTAGTIAAASFGVILMTTAVVGSVAIHAIILKNISLNQAAVADNDVAVAAMQKELEGGEVDVGRLAADEETLRKLNALD